MSKRKKPTAFHTYDPVHKQNYYFLPGFTPDEAKRVIKNTSGTDVSEMSFDGNGKCVRMDHPEGGPLIFIWIKKKNDIGAFVHEVFHAVTFAMFDRGFLFDNNQEAYCYVAGFLTEKFWGNK